MKKTKFSEEKIISAVKQMESGRAVKEYRPRVGCHRPDAVQLESQVRRHGGERCQATACAGG